MTMKCWTGFRGKKDKAIRDKGKRYYAMYILEPKEGIVIYTDPDEFEEALETQQWEDWVCVVARNKTEVKKNYDRAFIQARDYTDAGGE
jgi:hypothetical protein